MFLLTHPRIASQIGAIERNGDNISSIADRVSERLGLQQNDSGEGSEVNAFRHTFWQAMITAKFGGEIATEVGNAHEDEVIEQPELATVVGPEAS